MPDIWNEIARYHALQDEFYASAGVRIYNAALSHSVTCYTFQRNFVELHTLIKLHFDLASAGKLGDFNNRAPLDNFLRELTRLLHNFLAASKSLIDHTRTFVVRSYGEASNPHTEYETECKKCFDGNGVCKLMADLRNHFTHVGAPFVKSVSGGSAATGRDRFTLRLDIDSMNRDRPLSAGAKEYIQGHKNIIDLELYMTEYYELIAGFYDWFMERNQEWSKKDWEQSLAIHDEAVSVRDGIVAGPKST